MLRSIIIPMLVLTLMLEFVSCKQNGHQEAQPNGNLKPDAVNHELKKVEIAKLNSDSLAFDKILQEAVKTALKNSAQNIFTKKYEVVSEADGLPVVEVKIDLAYHFTKALPHLIIRRKDPGAVRIDIFSKEGNKFRKILSHEEWSMVYTGDTIRDINGDGRKDFVVNWYGSNGCCLKAFSIVYLMRNDDATFAKNIEFINPTFSPKEGVVRGVCYGHPGETEMYKYKWNGEAVDTLEYISYEMNDKGTKTGRVILSSDEPYSKRYKVLKILNAVPKEYHNIGGYDWFTGKCCP